MNDFTIIYCAGGLGTRAKGPMVSQGLRMRKFITPGSFLEGLTSPTASTR